MNAAYTEQNLSGAEYHRQTNTLTTEIDNAYVSICLDDVWSDSYAKWDSLVPAAVAIRIATATDSILKNFVKNWEESMKL